jgi:hypothetical protein
VREYYESEGELKPGKKGCQLDAAMLETLSESLQVGAQAAPAPAT